MSDTAEERVAVDAESIDWWPHKKFCQLIGKGEQWAWGKIKEGKWVEGEQFVRDPDGNIWVSIKGWKKWLTSNTQQAAGRTAQASRSDSAGGENDSSQSGPESPRKRTSKRRPVYALK